MRRSFLVKAPVIPLCVALLALPGCGKEKGGDTETSGVTTDTTQSTQATQATQTMGATTDDTPGTVGTDTTAASDTAAATTATDTETTPTTAGPTTADPTTGGGAQFCGEACVSDADCLIHGEDAGYTCQDNRCVTDAYTCTVDAHCDVILSGWQIACAAQADCPNQTYACIDIGGGVGRCAVLPSEGVTCDDQGQGDVMADPIEGGAQIPVCGTTGGKCDDGACFDPCQADIDCKFQTGHPVCNLDTSRCECGTDADCANSGIVGYGVCVAGVCRCGQDSDCDLVSDKCFDGDCGCSSVDGCQSKHLQFDGTTKVCEGP